MVVGPGENHTHRIGIELDRDEPVLRALSKGLSENYLTLSITFLHRWPQPCKMSILFLLFEWWRPSLLGWRPLLIAIRFLKGFFLFRSASGSLSHMEQQQRIGIEAALSAAPQDCVVSTHGH